MSKLFTPLKLRSIELNPPRGKPRGIFTERMKIDFQFAH